MFIILLLLSSSLLHALENENQEIRIGVLWCHTGKFENEAQEMKRGYDLWEKTINAGDAGGISVAGKQHKVKLIYADDQSDPGVNRTETERLIRDEKVDFLFGSYSTELTEETAKVAKNNKKPLIAAGASADSLFRKDRYLCGVLTPASQYAQSALELLQKSVNAKTVSIFYEKAVFALEAKRGAEQTCKDLGLTIVQQLATPLYGPNVERHPVEQTTAQHNVNASVEPLAKQPSDVLLSLGHFYDDARFFRALKETNINPKALLFTIGPALPEFLERYRDAAEGVLTPVHWDATLPYRGSTFDTATSYAQLFHAQHGYEPNYLNAAASAAGLALQEAITKAKSLDGTKVMEQLLKLDIMTFYGKIKIDPTGKNIGGQMVVTQIQNGKMVIVGPEKYATAKLVYPKPKWKK